MTDNRTTICGIGIAVSQALALVPYFAKWQWAFQGASIVLTALLGVFAADAKKAVQ